VTLTYGTGAAALAAAGTYTGSVVGSLATGGTFNMNNYTVTYANGDIIIDKAVLTITANTVHKTYGAALAGAAGSTAFTAAGLQNSETIGSVTLTYGTGAAALATAGTYTGSVVASLAAGGTFNMNNYTVTYANSDIIIDKAALVVTANNQSRSYGAANPALTVSYAGFVGDESAADLTAQPAASTLAVITSPVGTYPVTLSGASSANYTISYTAGTLTVTKAALVVTANTIHKAYGATLTGASGSTAFSSTGLQNDETIGSVTLTYGTGAASLAPAGTYTSSVVASLATGGTFNSNNYVVTYTSGDIIIDKTALTITANTVHKTYGATLAGASGSTAFTSTGLQNGETIGSVTLTYGTGAAANAAAGTYTGSVVASLATGGTFDANNYTITFTPGDIIIDKAALMITADNQSRSYGAANPALTISYAGFVGGESAADLTAQPAASTSAVITSPVGSYPVTVSGASSANYTISYTAGTLTVTKAALTITANTVHKTYGAALAGASGSTAFSSTGLQNGETIGSLTLTYGTGAAANATVGTYTGSVVSSLAAGGTFDANNYTITFTSGDIIIDKAALVVTANDQSRSYGAPNPALTISYAGFVAGESAADLTAQPAASTLAVITSPVGTYPVSVSGATSNNYTITYINGTLIIGKANLIVTANNQLRTYGAANPTLTFTLSGFVNDESIANLVSPPLISSLVNVSTPVGTYPIVVNGASSINYNVSYINGTMTITPATLNAKAEDKSRNYGSSNPDLTLKYTGFMNGDTPAKLISQGVAKTVATTTSLPGTYPITVSSVASRNYNISYTEGTLTVLGLTNALLNNLTISTGTLNPVFVSSTTNYTVNVGYSVTTEKVTPTASDPNAAITVNGQSVVNGNTSQNIPLIVGPNIITMIVTAQDGITKITYIVTVIRAPEPVITALGILPLFNTLYGTASTSAAFTVSGINISTGITISAPTGFEISTNNSTFGKTLTIPGTGTIAATKIYVRLAKGSPVGSYTGNIKLSSQDAITVNMGANGVVTPAPLIIIADDKTKGTNMPNPTLTIVYTGFVNNDSDNNLTVRPQISTTATINSAPGEYPITITNATSPNYTITYESGTLSVNSVAIVNTFTPNGDGVNDTWEIKNIHDYPNSTVEILNRNGSRVFYSINYPIAWDGKYNGGDLPAGTYYYVIRLDNTSKPLSGWVTILR
jgi:gliding motility-associated-like protein